MHQLEFTHKMERADCLVVCDVTHPHLREVRDMIEANIAIGQTLITTNGAFLIPRLWVSQEIENIPPGKIALLGYKEELLFHLLQIRDVVVICDNPLEASHQFACKKALLEGIFLAKELTNAPANQMTPAIFARRCLELQKWGIAVEILPPTPLLQAVGKGSSNPPQLVVMQLNKGKEPIALVGKGVCYDAGGIALKREFLSQMKWDKAGAAAVVGTMKTLALQKCPQHVVAVVALAENMPDGAALKPGDVIRSLSGKTVEVIDPDGEGRLILADSITYVQERFQPKIVIDLATLTLETFGALAGEFGGLFCNDRELAQKLIQSGKRAKEELWELPLGKGFRKQLDSQIADIKNDGINHYGASSVAAEFLHEFIDEGVKFAHLDISGVAWNPFAPEKGVTGYGVHLLTEFIV